jgi:hypothetical protein
MYFTLVKNARFCDSSQETHSQDNLFESHSRFGCLCVRLFCVSVVLCVRRGPCGGLIPHPRSPADWVLIKKLKNRASSTRDVES